MAGAGLSPRALAAVVDAAESLAEAASLEVLRQRAVEIAASLLPSTLVSWNEVDLLGQRVANVLSASAVLPRSPAEIADYDQAFIAHVAEHPVISHYQQTHDGRPYAISDFLSVDAFHRTNLYRRFYSRLGTEDQISFVLPDPRLVIGLAISRDRRGYEPDERSICTLLRAYLVQAYRTIEVLGRVDHLLATVHQIADDHGEAALVLDLNGRPQDMSPQAYDLLQKFFVPGRPHELPDEVTGWLRQSSAAIGAEPLLSRRDGQTLVIRRVHDKDRDILFLFQKADEDTRADARRLGLTPRETQVISLLGEGLATKRIATILAISPRTVDKHVASILDKLSVRSRLGAVSLLAHHQSGSAAQEPVTSTPRQVP
jgi:DNA-binding NarL/FixJ family response regulator